MHTHTCTDNQCHAGVLCCCCCRKRLLCAAPPTQISSDGAQNGVIECPLCLDGPWAVQGGSFGPPDACSVHGCAKTGVGKGP